jgi:hypothetical protein
VGEYLDMTETNEPTNATPDPIQLPSQDPIQTPMTEAPSSIAPKRANRMLLAGIAGAAALIAVAGVSGYAIGNDDDGNRGDEAGVSRFEANGAPGSEDGMRGGPDGMRGEARGGHSDKQGGDRRGHKHHDGGGMDKQGQGAPGQGFDGPGMPGPDADDPALGAPSQAAPSAPVTPSS